MSDNKRLLYENLLAEEEDIKDFILEGQARIEFTNGCMRMQNALSNELGQKANYVLWCTKTFPDNIAIEWEFRPVTEHGLCIIFFAAAGRQGEDLFEPTLAVRSGEYCQYHSGDINTYHISYFRRKEADERRFHTCNLRKSFGFHLVTQSADPLPSAADADDFYKISVHKAERKVSFLMNDLHLFEYYDDDKTYGTFLTEGKIGFRQLAPLIAEYRNFRVYQL